MDILTDPKFSKTVRHFELACQASRLHSELAAIAFRDFGDHGAQISGCVREHFPENVKEQLRFLAREVTTQSVDAMLARPTRVHRSTINRIGRLVATRDGSGFYGPQPYRKD